MSGIWATPRMDERQPLYLQIQEHFKKLISARELAANDKLPTEKQLMERFGVSRMTASNALTQLAKEGWIYRIPGRGSFVSLRPLAAQELDPANMELDATKRIIEHIDPISRQMIGLILPLFEDFFAIRLLKGVYSVLESSDFYVSIVLTHNNKDREKEAIQKLVKNGAVGLIIFPVDAEAYNEEIVLLKLRKFPFVLMDRYLPGLETNCVCSDNLMSAQLAVNHLWELGHRDIAICSDIPISTVTVDERVRGYMEALKQKGSMINPALILTDLTLDNSFPEHPNTLYSCIINRTATAYITLNMKLGMCLANFVKKQGLQVPRDMSIVTYDNPSSGLDGSTSFTYIEQYEESIGSKSAELLLQLLDHQERLAEPSKTIIKPSLVIGESSAKVPAKE